VIMTLAFLVTVVVFARQVRANLTALGDRVDLTNW
jgi:hypothetical protein